jgi:phage-related protein
LPLITSLINENSNALQNHKVMIKDVAMGINELADSINDSVEH